MPGLKSGCRKAAVNEGGVREGVALRTVTHPAARPGLSAAA